MKQKILWLITAAIIATVIFLSCRKEFSCEECLEANKPPVAIAGPDQVITLPTNSILLNGSASNDPDGIIHKWHWEKIQGSSYFTIHAPVDSTTLIKDLVAGTYQFQLTVTDNAGLSAKDTVLVMVKAAVQSPINHPPVANAGADTSIYLPANIAQLNGSKSADPDNNIATYHWVKIAGPASANISNSNAMLTQVTNLVQGTYQFQLTVTDSAGLFSKDTVEVMIPAIITPPQACTDCKIVFVSARDGNAEIYSCNADGSNIRRLTNDAGIDEEPAWSPDGTKIAFISNRTGYFSIYIMNADGSNPVRKTSGENFPEAPSWSPDGTKILYSTLSNGSANLHVIDVTGGSSSLLFSAPGYESQAAWSPNGTKIALVSDWFAYDIVYDIFTINANGTGFIALTGNIFDHVDYLHPSWSPNGTKLAVAISQTIGIDQYNTQVGIINTNAGGITALAANAAAFTTTSWSGDGTRIAYTSKSGSGRDVSWVSADGSAQGTIVTNGWNADWQH
jgi:Tol biopolymer transport system component